jgi:dihydrofolate reductase
MKISLIAAASTNRVIGLNNELPWHLPADMRFFKETTKGHHILMGRKTWESFPKPLPERTSLVVSTQTLDLPEGVFGFDSIEKAIRFAESREEKELMIIGGGKIYEETLPVANRIYLTRVYTKVPGGTAFFPPVKESEWKIVSLTPRPKDEKNAFDMDFMVLERK